MRIPPDLLSGLGGVVIQRRNATERAARTEQSHRKRLLELVCDLLGPSVLRGLAGTWRGLGGGNGRCGNILDLER